MKFMSSVYSLAMAFFALAAVCAGLASAQEIKAGGLVLGHAWARATPGGAEVGGGYLTIENKGTAPDLLLALEIASTGRATQIDTDLRALIRRMSIENPLWGALRIHGELLKLGLVHTGYRHCAWR